MNELTELRPKTRQRVIDLVNDAGVDVTGWKNFKGGANNAATNPKYCYEWAFVEPKKVVVLNLWHSDMKEQNGQIIHDINFYERASRQNKSIWQQRDLRLDHAIQTALKDSLPIRVIVLDGMKRATGDSEQKPSQVKFRALDPVPWSVYAYDRRTGICSLLRGSRPHFVDQFSIGSLPSETLAQKVVTGSVYVRDPKIRTAALARAGGRCEWCREPGFQMPGGSIYLETHHIIPLSENGPDKITNVIALCPNHHRQAHHGINKFEMRAKLLKLLEE